MTAAGDRGVAGKRGGVDGRMLAIWCSPVASALLSAAAYALLALLFARSGLGQGPNPYFVYLAEAFLHGKLALVSVPPNTQDLSFIGGHYYLYWPPMPALLFVPFVALFGVGVSDVPVTLAVAATNVGLVSLLLSALNERRLVQLSPEKRAWLTFFFAFGTVHLTLAPYAHTSYTGQLVGFGFLCAAYLAALRLPGKWAPVVSGVLVACALLSRTATLFAAIWIAWYLLRESSRSGRLAMVRTALAGLAPVCVAVALLAAYNYLRFGSVLDMGIDRVEWDVFSIEYLPRNLFYMFVFIPYLAVFTENPARELFMGGSLFLMSPVFFLAIPGLLRLWRTHGWALAASCFVGLAPGLAAWSTGWVQFGPRFTLDVAAPLLVATAMGASESSTRLVARLSLVSFIMYFPGAALLGLRGM